jgi:tetratricopeptide (TPR) repeat protein
MLNWLWLATTLALAGGCVTVPDKGAGINAGSTNSALAPNGTKFSRFWKKQSEILKLDSLAKKKPASKPVNTAPPNAEFFLTMAIAQEQAGSPESAETFYRQALSNDPKSLTALTAYAHFEDRRRHLNAATKLYKRALARYPEEAGVCNDLGLCYQRQGMLDESVAMLRKATQLNPERPLYHNNLATVLVDAERNDEALAQLLTVNTSAVAHYNLGCLLHRKGNDALAVDHFQKAIFDDPTLGAAQQWLAKLGPQVPAQPEPTEQRFAQRPRALQPMQVELGSSSEAAEVRVDDSAGPVTTPPAAPQTVTRQIPAQAVSRQIVRQRPVSAPIDEVVPSSNSEYIVQAADPPVAETPPAVAQATDAVYSPPPATDAVYSPPPATDALCSPPPVTELLPEASPYTDALYAPPPATESLPEAPQRADSLYAQPPATQLLPGASPATDSLFTPPATEPLPSDVPAATPQENGPAAQPAASGAVQYPHHTGHADSSNGFEMLPVAPLPEPKERPARPMSQPDEIEPLPGLDAVEEPAV